MAQRVVHNFSAQVNTLKVRIELKSTYEFGTKYGHRHDGYQKKKKIIQILILKKKVALSRVFPSFFMYIPMCNNGEHCFRGWLAPDLSNVDFFFERYFNGW